MAEQQPSSAASSSGCQRIKRSRTKFESTPISSSSAYDQYYSGVYNYPPPTYSAYPYEEQEYLPEVDANAEDNNYQAENCDNEQNYSSAYIDAYYDYLYKHTNNNNYSFDNNNNNNEDNYNDQPQVQQQVEVPPQCVRANCGMHSNKVATTTATNSQQQHQHRLGECRTLETGDEDPLGVGPELICELRELLKGTGLCSREFIYSLISMAHNSKFLFDGDNLIRVQPRGTVRQLFGTNACLYGRIKAFVRQKECGRSTATATAATRATPAMNEPHPEIASATIHRRIK